MAMAITGYSKNLADDFQRMAGAPPWRGTVYVRGWSLVPVTGTGKKLSSAKEAKEGRADCACGEMLTGIAGRPSGPGRVGVRLWRGRVGTLVLHRFDGGYFLRQRTPSLVISTMMPAPVRSPRISSERLKLRRSEEH